MRPVGTTVSPAATGRVWTVPNLLSFIRLLCIPVFVWLLFGRDDRLAASVAVRSLPPSDWLHTNASPT